MRGESLVASAPSPPSPWAACHEVDDRKRLPAAFPSPLHAPCLPLSPQPLLFHGKKPHRHRATNAPRLSLFFFLPTALSPGAACFCPVQWQTCPSPSSPLLSPLRLAPAKELPQGPSTCPRVLPLSLSSFGAAGRFSARRPLIPSHICSPPSLPLRLRSAMTTAAACMPCVKLRSGAHSRPPRFPQKGSRACPLHLLLSPSPSK